MDCPVAELLPDGTKQVSFSEKQWTEINDTLRQLGLRTKCSAAVFVDESGLLLSHWGTRDQKALTLLSTIVAANSAATAQMARILGEEAAFQNQFHQGETLSVYITSAGNGYYLLVVFEQETTLGLVRVMAEKARAELERITAITEAAPDSDKSRKQFLQNVTAGDFQQELSSRLGTLFPVKAK